VPGILDEPQRAALLHAIELFNRRDYFEAHEALEGAWRPIQEPARTFLKGLIHAAVALYQYQRGNSHGARVKTASARRYLEPYLPAYEGIDLQRLLDDLDRFVAPLHAQPRGAPPPEPQAPWPGIREA
jgi:predicted metal-dependent hydrolase